MSVICLAGGGTLAVTGDAVTVKDAIVKSVTDGSQGWPSFTLTAGGSAFVNAAQVEAVKPDAA
jgi:hypothetical protein